MRCELRRCLLVLCILQLTNYIHGQNPNYETLIGDEDVDFTSAKDDIMKDEIESNVFDMTTSLPEEANDVQKVTAFCLENCALLLNSNQCLCDCSKNVILGGNKCAEILVEDEEIETAISTTIIPTEEETTIATEIEPFTEESVVNDLMSCEFVGDVKGNKENCQDYQLCLPTNEGFLWFDQQCPLGTAFNALLRKCARDLGRCRDDEPLCVSSGTFPDNERTSSYIWCVPTQTGVGWHKYRVHCASYEVFFPTLGSCFIDVEKLKEDSVNIYQTRDVDIIKAELEEMKLLEKLNLKKEKTKLKMQKKLEKELMKKAVAEVKRRAKLEGKNSKELQDICLMEGAFASQLGTNFYTNCVLKKGKLKALTMMCSIGSHFNTQTSKCI